MSAATIESTPKTLDANGVSRILAGYLCMLEPAHGCADEAGSAIAAIFEQEAQEIVELSAAKADDAYSGLLLNYGATFGISAAIATMESAPQEALSRIAELVSELRSDMRERIAVIQARG
jgi:hypothetical protein